ncbi:MAG: TatD family hydrolase [Bacteroidales bacterium]|nr:TatD family hydrolase [Bacteroidales bacterium]MDD3430562.1 TatD family hydrolase [Bacteroidales bacterium]MDD4361106.1 TatD family hydrolase [Bacteroidales bacterium]MDD4429945.1 TatD family hydrolase [Bacteroidales bacterium]
MFIDIHTHRAQHYLKLIEQKQPLSLYSAGENSLWYFLNIEPEDFIPDMSLPPHVNLSTGIHPWRAHSVPDSDSLNHIFAHPSVGLIGEIGLDKKCPVLFEQQSKVFDLQLEMAGALKKPVLIHQLGSMAEILAAKKKHPEIPAWIIHGFRGKKTQSLQWLQHGFYLSFGPQFNEAALQACPPERLFFETDASGIAIEEIYKRAAQAFACSVAALEIQLEKNVNSLFKK